MPESEERLSDLRRKIRADPDNDALVEQLRVELDRIHGSKPVCARCGLSTHMTRGRLETKRQANWVESPDDSLSRDLGFKELQHVVGWRCRICNIVTLGTVERRDLAFDWVNYDI